MVHVFVPSKPASPVQGTRAAFTIVELLVTVGVIAVLVGLFLPALGRAIGQSRMVRDQNTIRQDGLLIGVYMNDFKDIFPIGDANAHRSMFKWHEAVIAGGYAAGPEDVDAVGMRSAGSVRVLQSMCMAYEPEYMRMGFTRPVAQADSSPITLGRVKYPAQKGWLCFPYLDRNILSSYFCCAPGSAQAVPMLMTDQSALTASRLSLIGGNPVIRIDEIGLPVLTSWQGIEGVDK